MKKILPLLLLLLALPLQAWVRDQAPIWKDGPVRVKTLLGSNTTYSDGCTPNETAVEAAKQWNPYMGRVQLEVSTGSGSQPGEENNTNEIAFTSSIYGEAFDSDVLAVTYILYDGTVRQETDILVNKSRSWDAYRGALQTKVDLRRVVAHELGHVLGLDHPDEHYQSQTALMNSRVSSLDTTVKDDQDGVASMYGAGTANPKAPPVLYEGSPSDVTCYEGRPASFDISVRSGDWPMTYQWYKDGNAIPNATSSYYQIRSVQMSDAGLFSCKVTNLGGTATSRSAQLKVLAAVAPKISNTPLQLKVIKGNSFSVSCQLSAGTEPYTYQWYKDDVLLPGYTDSYFSKYPTTASDAGTYFCKVTNKAGSDKADIAVVTIMPQPAPKAYAMDYQRNQPVVVGESANINLNSSSYTQSFIWYKDGIKLPNYTASGFSISKSALTDTGEYCALLSNSSGMSVSPTVMVTARPPDKQLGEWLACLRNGPIVYFVFESPARVDRYNLETGTWLQSTPLKGIPTAAAINDKYLCIAFGPEVRRYTLAIGEETLLCSAKNIVQSLEIAGDYLITAAFKDSDTQVSSYGLSDGKLCAELPSYYYQLKTLRYSGKYHRLFSRTSSSSYANLICIPVAPDGKFGTMKSAESSFSTSGAAKLYLSAQEDLVIDNLGYVFDCNTLLLVGSLGSCFTDISFTPENNPIILRGNRLECWDGIKMESGVYDMGNFPAVRVFVYDKKVTAFSVPTAGSAIQTKTIKLSEVPPKTPPPVVDPNLVSIVPSSVFGANDGSVYVLSKIHRYLFKWDPKTATYFSSGHIPLRGMANAATYNSTLNRIYLSYADNIVTQVRLDLGEAKESFYASGPLGLSAVIPYGVNNMVCSYYSSYSASLILRDKEGAALSSLSSKVNEEGVITPTDTQSIYYIDAQSYSSATLRWYSLNKDGTLVVSGGQYIPKTLTGPFCISASGLVLSSDGSFINPSTGTLTNTLGYAVNDVSFAEDTPYTVTNTLAGTEVSRHGGYNYAVDAKTTLRGFCASLKKLQNGSFLLVQWVDGGMQLRTLDKDLQDTAPAPSRILGLASRAYVGTGDDVLIPAFVINGTGKKRILIRALGPAMKDSVTEYLVDPQIVLHKVGQSTPVASNDNWGSASNLADLKKALGGAFPEGSKDSALLLDLEPGAYTVVTSGVGNTTGVGMVDVYDMDANTKNGSLVAIATRARTGTGERALIAGFVIDGSRHKQMHVQGLGPALGAAVPGRSLNPQMFLYGASGILKQNKDWGNDPEITAAQAKSGATKLEANSKDASLAIVQPPGAYSAIIEDEGGKEAITMVEVYEIPE